MGFIDTNPTRLISLHPWKTDIRAMAQMLSGEIDIPHNPDDLNKHGLRYQLNPCCECELALKLRQKFLMNTESSY